MPKRLIGVILGGCLLVPVYFVGAQGGLVPCNGPDCNLGSLIDLGNNLIEFFIYLSALVAVILLAWGGFKLVISRGNPGAMEDAKERIWNVIVGILIILLAWLFIQTVLWVLTGTGFEGWGISSSGTNTTIGQSSVSNNTIGDGNSIIEERNRARLQEAGISFNKGCGFDGSGTCVSGLKDTTINRVISLNNECNGCVETITGGSESAGGHNCEGTYTHCAGYKVDLRPNDSLDAYINSNYKSCGTRGGKCDSHGNEFVDEGDHWDVRIVK